MYATLGVSRIAGWCWIGAPSRGQPQTPAMRLLHGGKGLCVRRMTAWWTCRRPCMDRPVPRQFLRNVLLDVTTLMPAIAYNRASYTERYSRYMVVHHGTPLRPSYCCVDAGHERGGQGPSGFCHNTLAELGPILHP